MRHLLLALLLLLSISPASAETRHNPEKEPRDPGVLYSFLHGFAPETAVSIWRGPSRPPLKALLAQRGFELGEPVYIRLFKFEGVVEVWMKRNTRYDLFEVYPICINSGALGPKQKEGDRQAPEGFYEVNAKHLNPNSAYHLAINMGYPNAYDKQHGRTGAHLMIHGACASIGCYALTDDNIEEVYTLVKAALDNGQETVPVHAFPFRMTRDALAAHKSSPWINFWVNEMLPAVEAFDVSGIPPQMMACEGTYEIMDGLTPDKMPKNCTPITAWPE